MSDQDATQTGLHAQAELAPGTVLDGRYRIGALLGIGGMGVVYRATDLSLGIEVALKLLRPELAERETVIERFRQELLLARQVSSPHVVRIHDLVRADGRWAISMDHVDGEALDRRLDRERRLPVEDALSIARQIAAGLAAAHARGVIHRDLKPANILLDRDGGAYISDFGVARSLAASGGRTRAGGTRAGSVIGTPDYLSPEQARGEPADARSDLYALGLMLHEMLAGELPFAGGTVAEVLAQRMVRAPASLTAVRDDLPDWLVRLVDRLLRTQPAHRLQRAEDVIEAIDRRALGRDLREGARRGLRIAAVALVCAALIGGGLWWQSRGREAATATAIVAPVRDLDRLLVLPLTGSGDCPTCAARDSALSAHLRDGLAAVPGLAVVGRERASFALRRLDPGGQAALDPARLGRAAVARRVLRPAWVREGARWRLRATLYLSGAEAATIDGPAADSPAAALQAWAAAPATATALGIAAAIKINLSLPASTDVLDRYGAALLARDAGRLDEALRGFREAAAAPDDVPALLLSALVAQAQTALDMGDRDAAADALVRAQGVAAEMPSVRERLAAQRAAIEGDAEAAASQWKALLAKTPDDTEAELALAAALTDAGDVDAATAVLRGLSRRDPEDPRAWFGLGKLSILQGQARIAVDDHLVRALVAFKRGRDLYGEAETVNALGVGYGRLGQTADAAEQYRKAIELRRRLGNRRGEATSLRNLANVLSLTGDFDGAATALREARAVNIALGDRAGHAAIDNELGLLAEERGDHPGALVAFRRALQAWREVGDAHGAAEALNNIGFAHFQLGDYGDAEVYWQQAGDAYEALGEQTGRVRTMQNLGLLAVARGRWNDARKRLEESLRLSEAQQMVEEAAVSRRNLAELDLQQGDWPAAIAQAGRAEAAFRQRGDLRGSSDAGVLHVEALLASGDAAQARRVLDALAPDLKDASSEQQALAEFLRARLDAAGGDAAASAAAMQRAKRLASASGVRALQLRIDLFAAGAAAARLATLDAPIAALGHAGLRLDWLAPSIRAALAAGDTRRALAGYDEAARLLRGGRAAQAEALHRLGAQARRAAGDEAGARAADARAVEAGVSKAGVSEASSTATGSGASRG